MTLAEFTDWAGLLLRWGHVLAAIAWIGTSFYFNWFDLSVRPTQQPTLVENVRGTLTEVHGGSFYYHEQYWPNRLPGKLLAHSGPAQLTFLTGIALMTVYYWLHADVYMVDTQVAIIGKGHAILLSVFGILLSWPLYNKLCRSVESERAIFVTMAIATTLATCLYCNLFGGRAAFLQIGAMLGTIMALNVHFVIIPNHIAMVQQVRDGQSLDLRCGARAKRVSQHNNYFTLPVIFCMLSIHAPFASGHALNWLILSLAMGMGVTLRHWRNKTFKTDHSDPRLIAVAAALLIAAIGVSTTRISKPDVGADTAAVASPPTDDRVIGIIKARCTSCHSDKPTSEMFTTAPLGFRLDTIEQARASGEKILERTVRSKDMPLGNVTGMTAAERAALGAWIAAQKNQ